MENKQSNKPLFKTQAGASVLRKMLMGGTPEQIKARMNEQDLQTLKQMKASVSPDKLNKK